jgi:hypothetical protein
MLKYSWKVLEGGLLLSEIAQRTLAKKNIKPKKVMNNLYPLSAERTRKAIWCVSQAYARKCAPPIILRDKANH